ncbi:hypothetical protein B0H10DRAFT_2226428 [Mycena sp. CBHHK59/15]|nr:hypothetical protein B0H10DRAFT_2226428 [Mycena sp. CBHHK59/15]
MSPPSPHGNVPSTQNRRPAKAHIGSIRHQGSAKYGNTAVSGVVSCVCDHTVTGSFVDMIKGEAFTLGSYAQREHLKHYQSPPHGQRHIRQPFGATIAGVLSPSTMSHG